MWKIDINTETETSKSRDIETISIVSSVSGVVYAETSICVILTWSVFCQIVKPERSTDFQAVTVSKPYEICCEVVYDECEIKHSKEPQQQTLTRYEEVCDVSDVILKSDQRESVEFVQ